MGDDANVGRGHGGHRQANGNPFQVNSDDGDDEQDDDVENGDYDGNSEVKWVSGHPSMGKCVTLQRNAYFNDFVALYC